MLLDGKKVSDKILNSLKEEISSLSLTPTLAVILVGDNKESEIYLRNKVKVADSIGVNVQVYKYDSIEENKLKELIVKLNKDENVNGIMIQLPLPSYLNERELINLIDPNKDIDGLTDYNLSLLETKPNFIPATPLGVIKLLSDYNIDVKDKFVTIVGRSLLVGKPLEVLFKNMGANVSVGHSRTKDLKELTINADIIVSAVGIPNLIKSDMVKDNVIIVDVGITKIDNKITGDVDFNNISEKASYITPVPGGVGPMTIAMLYSNLIDAYMKQNMNELIKNVLVNSYGLKIVDIDKSKESTVGNVYIVTTDKTKYVIKVYDDINHVRLMIKLHALISSNNVNVPNVVKTINNDNYIERFNMYFVVYSFLEGKQLAIMEHDDIRNVAKLLRKIHLLTEGENKLELPSIPFSVESKIKRSSSLHFDLTKGNIFHGKNVGLIDFDDAKYGPSVCDVAILVGNLFFTKTRGVNIEGMNVFIDEYYKDDSELKNTEVPFIKELSIKWIDYVLEGNEFDTSTIESFIIKRKLVEENLNI